MSRPLLVLMTLMAFVALSLHGVADAACKVKEDAVDKEAEEITNPTNVTNKIQDAPNKRMRYKIANDAVRSSDAQRKRLNNKVAMDVPNSVTTATDDTPASDADDDLKRKRLNNKVAMDVPNNATAAADEVRASDADDDLKRKRLNNKVAMDVPNNAVIDDTPENEADEA